jgi:ribonuclease T2
MHIKTSALPALVFVLLFLTTSAFAKHHHRHDDSDQDAGQFDYYLLSLSWAPNYCAGHPGDHSSECRIGGHNAFVLHGLWPQASSGPSPMSCSNGSPVAAATVDHMLNFMPSRSLIQHEWQKHGTCTGLSAQDYFGQAEQAYTHVQVPQQYRSLEHEQQFSVADVEKTFADANHAPLQAFRVSCHAGELVSLEVCVDKNLQYRNCTRSVRECPVNQVDMRPPQ